MNRRLISLTLALGSLLGLSALDLPTKVVNGRTYYYYVVPPKQTIYSLTRELKMTREEIVASNPQVIDGLRAGDTLLFPADGMTSAPAEAEPTVNEAKPQAAEPDETAGAEVPDENEDAGAEATDSIAADDEPEESEINIAVVLPFMLDNESITRQAENMTNFYRGMLLAVESRPDRSDERVNIYAFDSKLSGDHVAELASRSELRTMDYIIAPDDSLSIETLAALADSTDAMVINAFAVKNDGYKRHESLVQINIPHHEMYAAAIKGFCDKYEGGKVLLVNATDIPAEKKEFTGMLTDALVGHGIPYEQIDYTGKLTAENLATIQAGRQYVVVPTSHSREALLRILPALTEAAANVNPDINLFGYPEWVVLRGDIKDKLHKLNTTVYSRFSTDLDGADADAVRESYARWYGTPMEHTAPITSLLGYDVARWLMSITDDSGADMPYEGIQTSFKLKDAPYDGGGRYNNALYLINFSPSGTINSRSL